MEELKVAIRQLIDISDEEMQFLLDQCSVHSFKRKEIVSDKGSVPQEIYFIQKGLIRVCITDLAGVEHTTHFAMEHQFIADYSSFLQHTVAAYSLQALEASEIVVMPRSAIEWGYSTLKEGEKMGRLIAEYYFNYLDNRIQNIFTKTPKERYELMDHIFPNIHNRVPQHMIASYIGITPVHLSRLKKADQ